MGILLGLLSALSWGSGDFLGGLYSRRAPALTVVFWSHLAGGLAVLVAALLSGRSPVTQDLMWGASAGLCGSAALSLFYQGLATGQMSIVAPISACGIAIPVLFALISGQAPSAIALAGIPLALSGIVLTSLATRELPAADGNTQPGGFGHAFLRSGIAHGLGAALGFGLFFLLAARGSAGSAASPLWVISSARLASIVLISVVSLAIRHAPVIRPNLLPGVVLVGLFDVGANVLYGFATTQTNFGIAAVLGSLYPVATVMLATIFLRERLNATQGAGVALALAGVGLVSAGS